MKRKIVEITSPVNDKFLIDWNIGRRCNFSCSYCSDELHDNFSSFLTIEKFKKFKKHLDSNDINFSNTILSFNGGEPTINPHLIDACKFYKECSTHEVNVISNGSRTLAYYSELIKYIDQLNISLHFEYFLDRKEEYYEKIVELSKFNKEFYIVVMCHPHMKKEVYETIDFLENNEVEYVLRRIRPKLTTQEDFDIEEELKYYDKQYFDMILKNESKRKNIVVKFDDGSIERMNTNDLTYNRLDRFKNFKCWQGSSNIYIHNDGMIYKSNCMQEKSIGNIDEGFFIDLDYVNCKKNICSCAADIMIRKKI